MGWMLKPNYPDIAIYPRKGTETNWSLQMCISSFPIAIYPRKGTETLSAEAFTLHEQIAIYPRKGTETLRSVSLRGSMN